ncbi:putative Serine/threonine protein kinase [uncultured Desulfobacterium sp.]|uniref:Putative Serine/threonine protein kinase n=1 Tax=uncultured Desulfobacterium sp. TaxID=201089 RepID=A0A445N0Z7_9BACT|nr:putative Serine/threonine protein kinase [uncultured Desulfobacterium sp.]
MRKIVDKIPDNQIREERSNYSLFAHEDEALDAIAHHVEAHRLGATLRNLELYDKQSNRYFETDLVVVSRFGVYVVELKHWSGRIEVRPNCWLQNRSFFKPDPHKANNFKAKLLRGLYDRKFPSFPPVYFESVVVLTNSDAEVIGCAIPKTTANNPTLESIDRFLQYLKWQREAKEEKLSDLQCQAFAEYIQKLNTVGPPRDFVFPGYEIVERLYQYEDRAEVVARRTDIRHRRLSRLRIFFLTSGDQHAREKATATLNAVEKIGDHSNILKVWDIPNENSYLVEGSDWSETGTLRDCLDRSGPLDSGKALAIAAGLARGLEAAHSQCIVHRALSPDNILMVNDTPKLMNFDLSFQLEDNRVTVIPDASKLKRSPYIAPEIYVRGTVPEATTDLFSLGVILYEMLVGQCPFGCSTDLERSNGRLPEEHLQKLRQVEGVSDCVVDLVCALVRQNPSDRIADANKVLAALDECTGHLTLPFGIETNPRLPEGAQSGLYSIQYFVTSGAESQVYRAAGVRGKNVALKLFNRDVPLPRIVDEQSYAAAAHHPSLVRVDSYSQWSDGRYYIAFDWASERSLREEIDDGVRPDINSFVRGAEQLLDAISSLHLNAEDGVPNPILHNDIKPENILLGHARRLVLIDFGSASESHIGTYEGTEGYVAPDLRLGKDRKYSVDGDLYALSISLHEWLLGCRPGAETSGDDAKPVAIAEWLHKGCSPDAGYRYPSAQEMKSALHSALVQPEPIEGPEAGLQTEATLAVAEETKPAQPERLTVASIPANAAPNPFVTYLNSLHSRSAANENTLAESQVRNPFFGHIHVPHPVTDVIYGILTGEEKKHVVLTGHAGDGKSTIAVDIFRRLENLPANQTLTDNLQRREILGSVSLVKDFSEWSPSERADLMHEMLDAEGSRFLLISNTGTLLDTFKAQEKAMGGNWVGVESNLLGSMNSLKPASVTFQGAEFVLVNVAMMDNLKIASQIFERMLAEERWAPCHSASCGEKCPIFRNVSLMQANLPRIRDRLFLAYRRMYEYGIRLTLRQLCAHMAYMVTSGLEYADIKKMAERAKPPLMAEFMFFNRFFGDNGSTPDPFAAQLRGVQAVRGQGFGLQPCPTWERYLWLRSRGHSFQLKSATAPNDFETLRRYGAGLLIDDTISSSDARDQIRRAVFFLHDFGADEGNEFLRAFLRSNMILDFVRWQSLDGEILSLQESNSLHKRIMHVLQEHFTGVRLPEGASSDRYLFVTLSRHSHDVRQSAQVVLARYPEDDFRIVLRTADSPAGGIRRDLFLEGSPNSGGLNLSLSLPFLDYVMLRNRGEIGKALQASYIDRLERFKGQLIHHATVRKMDDIMLVRLRTNNTFRRQIFAVRNGRLEVTDA